MKSRDGSLWIGTGNGLAQWKDGRVLRRIGLDEGLPSATIRALYETPQGMWIGTTAGIALLAPDAGLRAWGANDYPATGSFDFLADPDGTLWIASDAGLLRMREGRFRQYGSRVGLPRDTVMRILDDGTGSLWLSSNHGVFRIERDDLDALDAGRLQSLPVEVFDHGDGMLSSQCNGGSAPAGWMMGDGRLWFPTARGVAVVDPLLAGGQRRTVAPLVFESVLVDGQFQPMASSYRMGHQARRLVVRYAGLDMRSPGRQVYRYRLAGFDEDWQEAGSQTEVVYTSLPPGRFRFEVQVARSPADDWSQVSSAGFDLLVEPPFWYRPWFVLACGVGLAGLSFLVYALALAGQRRKQRRLQALVDASTRELLSKNGALEQAGRERDALLAQLAWQASHDALTGLPNRRAGDAHLEQAVARAHEQGQPLVVALLDVDRFKQINDGHGHATGDRVLQAVAAVMAGLAAERGCFVARHGGEEFLVCMERTTLEQALPVLEELRARVAAVATPGDDGQPLHCTCSAGVARLEAGQAVHALLARADARLLQAKQAGRNRVVSG
jgi:diguanylate cyclase (GGDEF)-like protein